MSQANAWALLRRQGGRPHVIAHRGASAYAPENTLSAFAKAVELGAVAVETDVHQTKDGVIVTLHDASLDRTTSGSGFILDHLWSDIEGVDAGSWFAPQFSGESLPSLDDYLSCLSGRAVPVIEVKGGEDVEVRLAARFSETNGGAFFFSFDAAKIAYLKAHCKRCPCLYLVPWTEPVVPCDARHLTKAVDMQMDAVGIDWERISLETVSQAHSLGLSVFVYTVNHEEALSHCLACEVDAVISDCPDQITTWLQGESKT